MKKPEIKTSLLDISSECLKIESDIEKLRVHLYAVGLASIAQSLGCITDRVRRVANMASPQQFPSVFVGSEAFIGVA